MTPSTLKGKTMAFRKKLNRRKSKRMFSRTASKFNKKNNPRRTMRGGIRL